MCEEISGCVIVLARNCLAHMLDYIVMQMKKKLTVKRAIPVVVLKGRRRASLLLGTWCTCRSDKVCDCEEDLYTLWNLCCLNVLNFKICVLLKMTSNSLQQNFSVRCKIQRVACNGYLPVYHPTVCSCTRSYQLLLYLKLPVIVETHHGSPNRHLEMSTQITINTLINNTEFHQMESDLFIEPRC